MDKYAKAYIYAIGEAHGEKELEAIINRIYEDGFEDGIQAVKFTEGRK